MTAGDYRETAQTLMRQALVDIEAGNVSQASENAWGAAVQAVKACAERRGWDHESHAELFEAVGQLETQFDDDQIRSRFHTANSLHNNFYENWMTRNVILHALFEVEDFVTALINL